MTDNWEERIKGVVGTEDERCSRNFERWRSYLMKELPLPLSVTGIEGFSWEEPYILGGWDMEEYEKLKVTNPSFTDIFQLLEIDSPDGEDDLVAKVKRESDGKVFFLGLSWLRTASKEEPLYPTLNDYSVWHCNY